MAPKKARKNLRKTELPTDTPTEFPLGDTVADIQRRSEEREQREGGGRQTIGEQRVEARSQSHRYRKQWPEKDQELGGMKVKWTQRVEQNLPHLNPNPGSRKDI